MPTFDELRSIVTENRRSRAIIQHLIDHIDETFRPTAGGDPKMVLLTDDKEKVPYSSFEEVIDFFLVPHMRTLEQEAATVTGTEFVAVPPPAEAAVEPGTQTTAPITVPEGPRRARRQSAS